VRTHFTRQVHVAGIQHLSGLKNPRSGSSRIAAARSILWNTRIADEILVKSVGIGTVTRRMMQKRAVEIAFINGRSRHNVLESDWEQARRELMGGEEMDRKEARLESIRESERWDPRPGSEGHKKSEAASDDEDREGRSDNESLAEAGIQKAEHEQMLQATSRRKGSGKPRKFPKWPS
jgi:hypothetical protein